MVRILPYLLTFILGVLVGGYVVYRNIDVVVLERYKKHRQHPPDQGDVPPKR